jgi:hypothetical protein
VPVALPHRLNVNGISALPRTVEPDVGGFTVTATSTAVTVTRTADAASGNVNVLVEFWHSIEAVVPLVPPPGQLIGQVPWVQQPGGGGGGTTFMSNCLIYRPGSGETGPIVFDTWAGLYAQLTALRAAANGGGCYTIQFDNSTSALYSDASIPAGAWDMLDVSWEGTQIGNPIVGGTSVVVLEQGATFTNGPLNFRYLAVYGVATALPPPFTITTQWEQQIRLFKTFFVAFDPAVPIYLIDGTAEGQAGARFIVEHSEINQGVNPTFWALNNGYAGFTLSPGAVIPSNTFVTDGTGEFSWEFYASSANVSEDQPLAPGAALPIDSDVNVTRVRHFTNEVFTVDENAYPGYLNRFDASGAAPINAQLEQTIASFNRYQWALIKETSGQPSSNGAGDMGLTIQPFAGDTIDGVLGPKLLLPGAQTALISDGSGGWNSAYTTAGVPEKAFASVVIDANGGLEKRIAYFNVGNATPGSGVVKNGAGDWTLTFNNSFPAGYFPIITLSYRESAGPATLRTLTWQEIDSSNIQVFSWDVAGAANDVPSYLTVLVHLAPEIID